MFRNPRTTLILIHSTTQFSGSPNGCATGFGWPYFNEKCVSIQFNSFQAPVNRSWQQKHYRFNQKDST
jgi:hypothetical protein